MQDNEFLSKIHEVFQNDQRIKFAYIFGSRARGDAVLSSDYDLAVYLNETDRLKRFDIRMELLSKVARVVPGQGLDLVIINDISSIAFLYDISLGKLIFSRNDGERADFELKTFNSYLDFRPFLEEYNKHYVERNT